MGQNQMITVLYTCDYFNEILNPENMGVGK